MTQVNFYTLSSEDNQSRYQFACRLAEKAVALGHRVLIHTDSTEQARQIDELLWQFKPSSFIPHRVLDADASAPGPEAVLISTDNDHPDDGDVLINLGVQPCKHCNKFNRINEILSADPAVLMAGRSSYRYYLSQGLQPDTHKL